MQFNFRFVIATLTAILLLGALPGKGEATDSGVCTGPYKNKVISKEDLAAVLKGHAVWLRDPDNAEALRANLVVDGSQTVYKRWEGIELF